MLAASVALSATIDGCFRRELVVHIGYGSACDPQGERDNGPFGKALQAADADASDALDQVDGLHQSVYVDNQLVVMGFGDEVAKS